jgi:hypothetical protein
MRATVTAADARQHYHRNHVRAGRLQRHCGFHFVFGCEASDDGKRAVYRHTSDGPSPGIRAARSK